MPLHCSKFDNTNQQLSLFSSSKIVSFFLQMQLVCMMWLNWRRNGSAPPPHQTGLASLLFLGGSYFSNYL